MREFVRRWFEAVDRRDAEALVEMTNPDVVIRPFLARGPGEVAGYYGHDGVRDWVGRLDAELQISLNLISVETTGPRSGVVAAEVVYETEGSRTGGMTYSVWRFDGGKLSEAIGYGSKEDALDAERGSWH